MHQLTQIMRLPKKGEVLPCLLVPPSFWKLYFFETRRCWHQIFAKNITTPASRKWDNSSYAIDISQEEVMNSFKSRSVEEKFKSLDGAVVMEEYCLPKISKVPYILCAHDSHFKKYYEPRMVAIGPYHYDNSNLKVTPKLKLQMAAHFIQYHNLRKEVLYSKIKREITNLRKCYEEEVIEHLTDEDLTWMFLLDGCTVMHYIYSSTNKNYSEFKELKIKVDCLKFVKEDIFLLENQLPFRVLKLLMSCSSDVSEMRSSIEKFIIDSIKALGEKCDQLEIHPRQEIKHPTHLLDLLRTKLLQSFKEEQMSYSTRQQLVKNVVQFIRKPIANFHDLIECIGKVLESSSSPQTQEFPFFRSVEELKAAGIRFRPSKTSRLTDITFNLGTLKLPPIIMDNSTISKFSNLIAYEMCPDFFNDFGISSYIVFLDSLIDRAEDVKVLRDNQILHNILGSDEEVVKLFNKISSNLVSNPEKYLDIKRDIQNRYDNKWMTWIAQFNHQHFQNPWSVLGFLAATVLLISTLVQTIYTYKSYHK